MTEDVAAPPEESTEPEWLEDLRADLRRVGDRAAAQRDTTLLDRLLGRRQA